MRNFTIDNEITLPKRVELGIENFIKNTHHGNLLYYIAAILIVLWALGFMAYDAGGIIHILLVLALISVLLQ